MFPEHRDKGNARNAPYMIGQCGWAGGGGKELNGVLIGLACQSIKSLSRLTPLVRTRMSSGGLPARVVIRWDVMSCSVMIL